jgi:archaellum biogenesis protein FlaJ (TadC family)
MACILVHAFFFFWNLGVSSSMAEGRFVVYLLLVMLFVCLFLDSTTLYFVAGGDEVTFFFHVMLAAWASFLEAWIESAL